MCNPIKKSYDQAFWHVGIYWTTPVFAHGHLNVAFTRTKNQNVICEIKEMW